MAKFNLKLTAQKMRKEGLSIIFIAKKLGVSKGSVSIWCRDIILTKEQYQKLEKNKGVSVKTGQRMGAEINKQKRIQAINSANLYGRKLIKNITKKELLLIATALYWCEGSKSDSTSSFVFVNSDPEMILLMKLFLTTVMCVENSDVICSIQINIVHEYRIKKVLIFWKNLLQLGDSQFRKPYYIRTKASKVYKNHNEYYGVCRLIVKKGMNLKYQMIGLIKALRCDILSA